MRFGGDQRRALTRAAVIGVALVAVATACSDGETEATPSKPTVEVRSDTTEASNGSKSLDDSPTTTEPTGQAVTVQEGELDLSTTPGALVDTRGSGLYHFEDLSAEPTVTVDPEQAGNAMVLSPDARYAVLSHPGDAVRKARVEIVTTADGKAVASHEVDASSAEARHWAPDSTAVLVGGRAGDNTWSWTAVGVDGATQALTGNYAGGAVPLWGRGSSQTKVVECAKGCSPNVQLMTSKGMPVTLASTTQAATGSTTQSGRIDPDTGQITPFAGPLGAEVIGSLECGRFAVLTGGRNAADDGQGVYVYDSDTDKVTPISAASGLCPIVSPGGTHIAIEAADDSVHVIELATGTETEVARDGKPLAWSKDSSELVVTGNGTFVVAADGSGGKAASIEIQSYCDIGDGTVVVASAAPTGERELVRYDIASDSAQALSRGSLDQTCELSKDGKWIVSGTTLIDLGEGTSGTVVVTDGQRNISGRLQFIQPKAIVAAGRA